MGWVLQGSHICESIIAERLLYMYFTLRNVNCKYPAVNCIRKREISFGERERERYLRIHLDEFKISIDSYFFDNFKK